VSALAEQHERWVQVRSRLWPVTKREPVLKLVPPPEPVEVAPEPEPEPTWQVPVPAPYDAYVGEPIMPRITGRMIALQTARKHGLTIHELLSPRRQRKIVLARHEAMWRCVKETSLSLPHIGRILGGKDHTTVLHGVRRHQQRIDDGTAL